MTPPPIRAPILLHPGLLNGHPLPVDPASLAHLADADYSTTIASARLCHGWEHVCWRGGEPGVVVRKTVEDNELGLARRPRNLRREVALLGELRHPNVLGLLEGWLIPPAPPTDWLYILHTPLYALSLAALLRNPAFVSGASTETLSLSAFTPIALSLSYQLLAAVAYLHSLGIGHRDVNPNNLVISRQGRLVLIDFGLATQDGEADDGQRLMHEVGTGAYRAPELLLGSTAYSPLALDLWSVGATLAAFFRPVPPPPPFLSPAATAIATLPRPTSASYDSDDDADYGTCSRRSYSGLSGARTALFEPESGARTDFAYLGRVFKVVGTPTAETWPETAGMPTFARFSFVEHPPSPLTDHLPYLAAPEFAPVASVIGGMLKCSAGARMEAEEARHLVLSGTEEGGSMLRPVGEGAEGEEGFEGAERWEGRTLGEWLAPFV